MKAVRGLCGGLVACQATGMKTFEVTMSHIKGINRMLDGFKIGNSKVWPGTKIAEGTRFLKVRFNDSPFQFQSSHYPIQHVSKQLLDQNILELYTIDR